MALGVVLIVVEAPPAWAHGAGTGPSGATNYRSTLLGVTPPLAGFSLSVVDDGQRVIAVNTAATPVVILGYSGEPYLMLDRFGVWQNVRSPSLYINRSSGGGLVYMPPGTDPKAPPQWRRACRCDEAVWHDHRVHWGAANAPAAVAAAPGRYHLVETWRIGMCQGTSIATATGIVAWIPGPSPAPWLVIAAVAAVAITAVGLSRRWRVPLAVSLLVLFAADFARSAGVVGGYWGPFLTRTRPLPYHGVFAVLLWAGLLLVARFAFSGRAGAAWAAATVGVVTALTEGVPSLSGLWHSQMVTAYPADLQRLLTAVTLGIGVGLFAACVVLIDRLDKLSAGTHGASDAETGGDDGPKRVST